MHSTPSVGYAYVRQISALPPEARFSIRTERQCPLSTYDFNSRTVRVVGIDGKPWFVATDVRSVLGIAKYGRWLSYLSADEAQIIRKCGSTSPMGHGLQIISESGLYKIIMRSDKSVARTFQDSVTREVLPSIRKSGSYGVKPVQAAQPASDLGILEQLVADVAALTREFPPPPVSITPVCVSSNALKIFRK